ncbi:helix-turn-helix domain-containing protein [Scytonema millei]|uniref:Helix-turn-helix transcriptional regulator n=1 Tax=Scytonema millei VB511283 TaxID=1245923 RepID=A0A9X5E1S4_9CYAN|nr:helix-turn-helix transcriptional regulator [Scytonema millei]NHC33800.1 helix-turn-helix transcriptional regulator [Scytonema millei VB511283]
MMSNTLRDFCEKRGTTLFKLATAIGVSPSNLYRLGKHTEQLPSLELIDKILNLYPDASIDDLIKHVRDTDAS